MSANEKLFKKRKRNISGDILSVVDVVVSAEDGTIIIPTKIREKLGVTGGTRFAVVAEKDTLIFKKIEGPSKKEFEKLVEDVEEIIRTHREPIF